MSKVGIDICCLPEADGCKYVVVAIDYFSKWWEAKALPDKTSVGVALFLYELVCRFGCFATQINDQGREFVNAVSDEFASAYRGSTTYNKYLSSTGMLSVCIYICIYLYLYISINTSTYTVYICIFILYICLNIFVSIYIYIYVTVKVCN